MLRADVEKWAKANKRTQVSIYFEENERLATYCTLQGGYLVDYTGHRVDRKRNIWGWCDWSTGRRVAFDK